MNYVSLLPNSNAYKTVPLTVGTPLLYEVVSNILFFTR